MDYDQIFELLTKFVHKALNDSMSKTKVVLIPSAREINHVFPLPQPGYRAKLPEDFSSFGNPQVFKVNDITVGVINADIIKDLCMNLTLKESKEPKIEVALRSIL